MCEIATKERWNNTPITNPKLVNLYEIAPDLKLEFSEEQYQQLQKGLIPEQMEDKWYIYFEDNWLYFHRSWTGNGVYRTQIIKEQGDQEDRIYKIKEFYVERNTEIYSCDDDIKDLDIMLQLILWGLLRLDVRGIYAEKHGSGEQGALSMWSDFGRLFFPEDRKEIKPQ